jgi:hypothetical protein
VKLGAANIEKLGALEKKSAVGMSNRLLCGDGGAGSIKGESPRSR